MHLEADRTRFNRADTQPADAIAAVRCDLSNGGGTIATLTLPVGTCCRIAAMLVVVGGSITAVAAR